MNKEIVKTFWGEEIIWQENAAKYHWPIIKFTTTNLPTSLQVCPSNTTAIKAGYKNLDKNKALLVLKDAPHSYIYAGIKKVAVSEIKNALLQNQIENLLNKVKISKDMFINIPTGLIHSFGPGIEILEIQNYTGETLRLHDWGRDRNGKPVELNIEEALLAINPEAEWNIRSATAKQDSYKNIVATHILLEGKTFVFAKCLVVDLISREVYVAEDEEVELEKFLLVSLPSSR